MLKLKPRYTRTPNWYVEFKDHLDIARRLPATADRSESETVGRMIERLVSCRIAHEAPTGDLAAWLESCPPSMLKRLVRMDLVDGRRLAAGQPLSEHVAAYKQWMLDKGRNRKHVATTIYRIESVIDAAGVKYWGRLTPEGIEQALAELQSKRGLTVQSRNAYLTSFKSFCTYMVRTAKASRSPATGVEPLPVEEVEYRRALTADEASRLVAAAAQGPARGNASSTGARAWHLTGLERALLYSVALQTGFRAGALRRLRVCDFKLDGKSPSVTLPGAQATKNKRTMTQALQPRTAETLRRIFAGKLPEAPAFRMPPDGMAELVREDLARARADWIKEGKTPQERAERARSTFLAETDEEGRRVDFHSLRTTTGTLLALLDVPRAVTTRVMGHASYTTTDRYYNRIDRGQRRSAVDLLPDLAPSIEHLAATGTDGTAQDFGRPIDRPPCGNMTKHDDEKPAMMQTRKDLNPHSNHVSGDLVSPGPVAELADAADLKSAGPNRAVWVRVPPGSPFRPAHRQSLSFRAHLMNTRNEKADVQRMI